MKLEITRDQYEKLSKERNPEVAGRPVTLDIEARYFCLFEEPVNKRRQIRAGVKIRRFRNSQLALNPNWKSLDLGPAYSELCATIEQAICTGDSIENQALLKFLSARTPGRTQSSISASLSELLNMRALTVVSNE